MKSLLYGCRTAFVCNHACTHILWCTNSNVCEEETHFNNSQASKREMWKMSEITIKVQFFVEEIYTLRFAFFLSMMVRHVMLALYVSMYVFTPPTHVTSSIHLRVILKNIALLSAIIRLQLKSLEGIRWQRSTRNRSKDSKNDKRSKKIFRKFLREILCKTI